MPRNDFINVDGTINYDNIISKPDITAHLGVNILSAPYNADPTGISDSTAAFNTALNNYMRVYVPEGIYKISGTINIVKNGQKLIGAGARATQLISSNANLPIISINVGLNWLEVSNMTLDRSVPAIVGGRGISCPQLVSNVTLKDLIIYNQFNGLVLGGTDWSNVDNVTVQYCYGDAIYMQNLLDFPACQWQINNVLLSQNDGSGLAVRSVAGTATMPMGKISNINTFSNTGYGINVIAVSSCPIAAVRIAGGFLGADGLSEIYLDTYGGQHTITDVFMEQAGTEVTGRKQTTPASHIGSGIELTVNNGDVQISNCYTSAMSENGVSSRCADLSVVGGSFMFGGQAGIDITKMNGVAIYAGSAMLCGVRMNSNKYGLYAWDGQIITFTGCTFKLNTTSPVLIVANPTYMNASGNNPSSIGTVIPSGGILVGAGGVGGVPSSGVINVAVDVKKNNVAYVNP